MLGAYHGENGIPAQLKDGLYDSAALRVEIEAFKKAVAGSAM